MLLILTCLLLGPSQDRGLEIATMSEEANDGFGAESSEMELILINAYGDEAVRKMSTATAETEDDGDRSISIFHWPADVKGTKVLTWSHKAADDDQWLYLPSLKRVKRISSRNKSGAFMGSEFAYEDLGSQEVEKYHHKYLEDAEIKGRACWKLERVPVSKRSGYSKQVVWMDQEYLNPMRIDYYDRKGELLKVADFRDYRKVDRWWRVFEIFVDNKQTQKKSIVRWSKRELGATYDEDYFVADNLTE